VEGNISSRVATGGPIFDELFGLHREDLATLVNLYSHYIPPASADFFARNLTDERKLSQNFLSASKFDGKSVHLLDITHVISDKEISSDLVKRVDSGLIEQSGSVWHLYKVNENPNENQSLAVSDDKIIVDLAPTTSAATIVLPTSYSSCNRASFVGDSLARDTYQIDSYSTDGLQSFGFPSSSIPRRLIVSRYKRGIEFITCQIGDLTLGR
jgi:hypothetical protein